VVASQVAGTRRKGEGVGGWGGDLWLSRLDGVSYRMRRSVFTVHYSVFAPKSMRSQMKWGFYSYAATIDYVVPYIVCFFPQLDSR
jgi:hypothetical protein